VTIGNHIINYGALVLTPPGASAAFAQSYTDAAPIAVSGNRSLIGPTGGGAGSEFNMVTTLSVIAINCTGASGTINWMTMGS
jgi:hypothetical protein